MSIMLLQRLMIYTSFIAMIYLVVLMFYKPIKLSILRLGSVTYPTPMS